MNCKTMLLMSALTLLWLSIGLPVDAKLISTQKEKLMTQQQKDYAVQIASAIINDQTLDVERYFNLAFPGDLYDAPRELKLLNDFNGIVKEVLRNDVYLQHNAGRKYTELVNARRAVLMGRLVQQREPGVVR